MRLADYFKKAKKEKFAIPQFNFSTFEQLEGIAKATQNLKSPVILGTSEGECAYFGIEEAVVLVGALRKKYGISAFLNLDHGKSLELLKKCVDLGYDSIHFDGSFLPIEENVKQAREIAQYARKKGVMVEGELGCVRGASEPHKESAVINERDLTIPEDVVRFLKETKVDRLAVAIGNVHGMYDKKPDLDFARLEKINEIAKTFLVLHGGSGIDSEQIKKSIGLGITKVNFNTELRIAWHDSLKNVLNSNQEVKPYKILPQVQEAVQRIAEEKIILLGSQNKA